MLSFASQSLTSLVDEPIEPVLQGAQPGERFKVNVSLRDHLHRLWSREFEVEADNSGMVDIALRCQGGDGLPYDPHALVHLLAPTHPARWTNEISYTLRPLTVLVEVLKKQEMVAATEFVRTFLNPDVIRHEWRTRESVANLYRPSTSRDPRSVIVLPGAWGGFDWCNQIAALIAARGRPALALPYFDWQAAYGLPASIDQIPLEYAQRAAHRLRSQPYVDPDHLSVIGMSKGAEFAIAWAAHDSSIDELIALSPTLHSWESVRENGTPPARSSWTFHGRPLPFLHFNADAEFYKSLDKTLLQKFHDQAVAAAPHDSPSRLPVQDISARTLLISQEADTLWPASRMGDEIARLMRAAGNGKVEHIVVPGRGHAMFVAGVPANGIDASPRINGLAQTEIWSRVRGFLSI